MVAFDLNLTSMVANGNTPAHPALKPVGFERTVQSVPSVEEQSSAQDQPHKQSNEKPSPLPQPTARFGYDDERVIELLDTNGEVITTFSLEVSPDQDPIRGHDLDKVI